MAEKTALVAAQGVIRRGPQAKCGPRSLASRFPYLPAADNDEKNVLIVDDDDAIRESLRRLLQAESYDVRVAANGQEALDHFDPARVDLLLLDLNLPAKSGWDLATMLTNTL